MGARPFHYTHSELDGVGWPGPWTSLYESCRLPSYTASVMEESGPGPAGPGLGEAAEESVVVVVVGSGVAGLQTARALTRLGVAVVVVEEAPTVGGCWCESYHKDNKLQGDSTVLLQCPQCSPPPRASALPHLPPLFMCHAPCAMCHAMCHVSCVMCHAMPCVMRHVSCAMCHVLMCHVSCTMCHVSCAMCPQPLLNPD